MMAEPGEQDATKKRKSVGYAEMIAACRRDVDAMFPKWSEEARVQATVAIFNAQMTVYHATALTQALMTPDQVQLAKMLAEQNQILATATHQLQLKDLELAKLRKVVKGED